MPTASKVGTIDPMGKGRVYVDETLTPVPAGSPQAAFVYKRGDLETFKERRTKLGLDKNDEALRVMIASRKVEVATVEQRMSKLKAELAALTEEVEAAEKTSKGPKASSTSTEPKTAEELGKLNRDVLDAMAKELGIEDPESLANKPAVAEAIVAAQAAASS